MATRHGCIVFLLASTVCFYSEVECRLMPAFLQGRRAHLPYFQPSAINTKSEVLMKQISTSLSRRMPSLASPVMKDAEEGLGDETCTNIDQHTILPTDDAPVKIYYSPNKPMEKAAFFEDDHVTIEQNDEDSLSQQQPHHEYSFYDEATIQVRAGSGGQGSSTYKRGTGGQDGPPDGGGGGKGGNVWLVVDDSLNTLAGLTYAWRPNAFGGSGAAVSASAAVSRSSNRGGKEGSSSIGSNRPRIKTFRAENGADGGRQFNNGRSGADVTIRVPPGTIVQEIIGSESSNGDWEKNEQVMELGTLLLEERPKLMVAKGGEGGEGSGINSRGRGVQRPRTPPEGGQRRLLRLTLKLVADVALVGVPNTGKSTFLSAVTRAKPKISDYPFTTVIPNLGVWVPPQSYSQFPRSSSPSSSSSYDNDDANGGEGLVLCDVPGLVMGASQGVGLGHAFLRHVERCHVILHLIDATSNDPVADFQMLNRELVKYGTGQLAQMPQVVVVNKIDVLEKQQGRDRSESARTENESPNQNWEEGLETRVSSREELEAQLKEVMSHSRLMWMSAKEGDGVDDLMMRMATFVKKVKAMDKDSSQENVKP